ncbi:MAG: DapH/DapD/GlmU-related protein [Kiritimatiellae bacterium]|nr:DapH/DapD/GlmU-related protein [Kiritimatiellia bacterium]
MKLKEWMDRSLPAIVDRMANTTNCPALVNTEKSFNLAGQKSVYAVVEELLGILFPGCHGSGPLPEKQLTDFYGARLRAISARLADQVENAFRYQCLVEKCGNCGDCRARAEEAATFLIEQLPSIRELLQKDIQAAYEGDPAARSFMEIVMSYPGLQAIAVHRLAHPLYEKGVPLIPRIMTELAHSRTGIDIHPGAKIGAGFFIDHGTGVVIGETCVIGKNVKIYQGVTLGALSFPKDEQGNPIKGIKRHPEVRNNATIYAGATILGGQTIVGEGAVIGGNVWLTHSVPAGATVYNRQPKPEIKMGTDGARKTSKPNVQP